MIAFPGVPADLLAEDEGWPGPKFVVAPEVRAWAYQTFIYPEAPLFNEDHEHLQEADVLFLWSSVTFKSKGFEVVASCQLPDVSGRIGGREFADWQYRKLNDGKRPDFVVTFCAPFFAECASDAICAVTEHELYHAKQKVDRYGVPMLHRDGSPVYEIRGHEVEEHLGVARRYGAWSPALQKLKEHLNAPPEIPIAFSREAVCGCGARF